MNGTSGNVMRMQQEAEERVRRMQEHSRRLIYDHPINVYRGVSETSAPQSSAQPMLAGQASGLAALLQGDQEQTLVLLLAVMLAKNGAPLELVLALMYVAM